MQTLTSREFNQDTARAKRAANDGPVFITDRGKRAYVLLSNADYERLAKPPRSIVEALAMAGLAGPLGPRAGVIMGTAAGGIRTWPSTACARCCGS